MLWSEQGRRRGHGCNYERESVVGVHCMMSSDDVSWGFWCTSLCCRLVRSYIECMLSGAGCCCWSAIHEIWMQERDVRVVVHVIVDKMMARGHSRNGVSDGCVCYELVG